MDRLTRIYEYRFSEERRRKKYEVWQTLCESFFQRFIRPEDTVLDIGCGMGEFLNNVRCRRRIGVDLYADSRKYLAAEVEFHVTAAHDLSGIADASVDFAFCSNLLEHMPDKQTVDAVLSAVLTRLRPGGRFMIMGPNMRMIPHEYWDFWDHYVAISDRSLCEALYGAGYEIESSVARFLPYTTRGRLPQHPFFVRMYVRCPLIWRLLGKQFLVTGRRPAALPSA